MANTVSVKKDDFTNVADYPNFKYGVVYGKLLKLLHSEKKVDEWLNTVYEGFPKSPKEYMEEGNFAIIDSFLGWIDHPGY